MGSGRNRRKVRRHTGPSHPAGCRNQTHPCSLVLQNGERNRITPAVRLRGHSARLPSGLLALVSPPPYQARWHPCLEVSDHCRFGFAESKSQAPRLRPSELDEVSAVGLSLPNETWA